MDRAAYETYETDPEYDSMEQSSKVERVIFFVAPTRPLADEYWSTRHLIEHSLDCIINYLKAT